MHRRCAVRSIRLRNFSGDTMNVEQALQDALLVLLSIAQTIDPDTVRTEIVYSSKGRVELWAFDSKHNILGMGLSKAGYDDAVQQLRSDMAKRKTARPDLAAILGIECAA